MFTRYHFWFITFGGKPGKAEQCICIKFKGHIHDPETDLFKKSSFRCRRETEDPEKTYGSELGLDTKCTYVPGPKIKPAQSEGRYATLTCFPKDMFIVMFVDGLLYINLDTYAK